MKPFSMLIIAAVLLFLVIACAAYADTIILKNGGRLHGKIESENDREVVIKVANMGTVTVRRSRIKEIRKDGPSPPAPAGKPEPSGQDEGVKPEPAGKPEPEIEKAPEKPLEPTGKVAEILDQYVKSLKRRSSVELDVLKKFRSRLVGLGREATKDISIALKFSKDWRVRYLAVESLRELKDSVSIPALVYALGDQFLADFTLYDRSGRLHKDYRIRKIAVKALDAIGKEAHEAVAKYARDKNSELQDEAVWGLRDLAIPYAKDILIDLVKDSSQKDDVRKYAAEGLCKKGKKAHKTLVGVLPDKVVRKEAALALQDSRDEDCIEMLMKHVRKAGSDYELADISADIIYKTDKKWTPGAFSDHVDYMLLTFALKIKKKLGQKALPRLNYWANSESGKMSERARHALSMYKEK